jgi:broad specificity phosphatase PhoE
MLATFLLLVATAPAPVDKGPLAALGRVPADTVRLFLIRHGQALSNLDPRPKLAPEELDHLTPLGQTQADRAAALLRGQGVRLVLTSPAGRARETAGILQKALETGEARVEDRVRPLQLGRSANGKALGWDDRQAEWKAGRDPQPPGGESLQQVVDRELDLVGVLARERVGQAVVLVSHGEVIAALVGSLQHSPAPKWEDLSLENGSVTVVEAQAGKPPHLVLVNVSPGGPAR